MSILSFIKKVCVQPAVYWQYNGSDGQGGSAFLNAVEIKVRWDEGTEVLSDSRGQEFTSHAQVLTPGNLVEQSYLWLGSLEDLPLEQDPVELPQAFAIKKMERYPLFKSTTQDVFLAYL